MKGKKDRTISAVIVLSTVILLGAALAMAQPTDVDSAEVISSERRPSGSGMAIPAQAGNVTQLHINATRITNHWQGYYGNITGEITLQDADSNTLYAWDLANPEGEILAVNTSETVAWSNVTCVNFTTTTTGAHKINMTTLDGQFGIDENDVDNFNETFSSFFTGTVRVGDVTIDSSSNCPQTYLFVNNQSQSSDFQEVLLFDNSSALIFTALLEPGSTGFDGNPWDFQMLVAQVESEVGSYYFYVELS